MNAMRYNILINILTVIIIAVLVSQCSIHYHHSKREGIELYKHLYLKVKPKHPNKRA